MKDTKLWEKIQAVSMEVKSIEKDMTVGKGSYSYKAVSDTQVTLLIKSAEEKHKIMSIPIKQELISSDTIKLTKDDGKQSITYVDNIKMTLRIKDLETGEHLDIESFGKGIDSSDKGFGKASTYARKYALLNAYKIATGEDPDAEKSQKTFVKKEISEKRIDVINYLNANAEAAIKASEHFNVSSVNDLSDKDIKLMYDTYKKRSLI